MKKLSDNRPNHPKKASASSMRLALESRLLFDGAVVATAEVLDDKAAQQADADHGQGTADNAADKSAGLGQPAFALNDHQQDHADHFKLSDLAAGGQAGEKNAADLLVIDARAESVQAILAHPPVDTDIRLLDPKRDGFQQIQDILQERGSTRHIQIEAAQMGNRQWLGNSPLNGALSNSVHEYLSNWGDYLSADADITFHGLLGHQQQGWLDQAQALTGAQVLWSADPAVSTEHSRTTSAADDQALAYAQPVAQEATALVFVDTNVNDYQSLLKEVDANATVILLDGGRDGVEQIAETVAQYNNIASVHIVSHGNAGELYLGSGKLDYASLSGQYADEMATIKASLSSNADILIYGCNFGSGLLGELTAARLAKLTGADVADSTDDTGSAAKGGNWVLENQVGSIESQTIYGGDWDGLLKIGVVNARGQILVGGSSNGVNGIFSVDIATGKAVLLKATPDSINGVAFNAGVTNGIAVDQANGLYYFTDAGTGTGGAISPIYAWDFINDRFIQIDGSTAPGMQNDLKAVYGASTGFDFENNSGLGAVAGNGKLFIGTGQGGIVNGVQLKAPIYEFTMSADGRTVLSGKRLVNDETPLGGYGDLGYDPATNILVHGQGNNVSVIDGATGKRLAGYSTGPIGQLASGVGNEIYAFGGNSTIRQFNPFNNTFETLAARSMYTLDAAGKKVGLSIVDAAGFTPPSATYGDRVFWDLDKNNVFSAGDKGIANVTIDFIQDLNGNNIVDPGETILATDVTDADGFYEFSGVLPGNYIIKIEDRNNAIADAHPITVPGGTINSAADLNKINQVDLTIDFPFQNRPPVAKPDGPITTFGGAPSTGNVITGAGGGQADTDVDGDILKITEFAIAGIATPFAAGTTANIPGKGTLKIEEDGSFTFTPAAGYQGPVPTATYSVTDGVVAPVTADLSFKDVPNTPPTLVDDGPIPTLPNTAATGNVLGNDSDANGQALTVTQFAVDINGDGSPDTPIPVPADGSGSASLKDNTGKDIGTLSIGSDGAFTFTPATGYNGPVPVATYTATDGFDTSTAKLTIAPVPDRPPVAVNDGPIVTAPNAPATGNVIGNDSDPDGDPLTVTQFVIAGVAGGPFTAGTKATIPGVGTLQINADGSFTFTPDPAYDGPVPKATYTVSNGVTTSTADLSFADVPNTPPVAVKDGPIVTAPNTTATGNVITGLAGAGKDSDAEGDALTVTQFAVDTNGDGTPEPITVPAGGKAGINLADATGKAIGTLEISSTGAFAFKPAPAYDGPVPVATYTISDGTASATATLKFADVPNRLPIAVDDKPIVTTANQDSTGNVLTGAGGGAKDTDPDGDTLTVTQFAIAGVAGGPFIAGTKATIPNVGTLQINADGSFTFTPDPAYDGPVPVATYTISDGTDTATATLEFAPVPNTPPVAVDDGPIITAPNTKATGNVLTTAGGTSEDTDDDGDTLTVTQFSVDIDGDGTPETIIVPANSVGATPLQDATGKDIGVLIIGSNGEFTFTPAQGYDGSVPVITYTISDGTDTATATLKFADVPNNPPVAKDDGPIATVANTEATGNVIAGLPGGVGKDSDPDLDTLTVTQFSIDVDGSGTPTVITVPAGGKGSTPLKDNTGKDIGSLEIASDGTFKFTPAPAYDGSVPVATYTISDGTATATATLSFAPVPNTPPVAVNDGPIVTLPNTKATGNVITPVNAGDKADTDTDSDKLTVTQFSIAGIAAPFNAGDIATIPNVGTLQINADGSYTFTPANGYDGPVPVATYTISDGTATATATLKFADVPNNPPVANNDGPIATLANTDATGNVIAGLAGVGKDSDADDDTLTVTQFSIDADGNGTPKVITVPAGGKGSTPLKDNTGKAIGTLEIASNGTFKFTPALAYDGPVPVATYTISDGTATATATLTFAPVPNAPPVAVDDGPIVTASNTTATGNVITPVNADDKADSDTDKDTLTVTQFTVAGDATVYTIDAGSDDPSTIATIPNVGSIKISADGSYTFTPNTGYDGPVPVITYTISDGTATDTATLTFNAVPNTPPVAVNDGPIVTAPNTDATGNVIDGLAGVGKDSDADSDALTVTQFSIDADGNGTPKVITVPAGGTGSTPLKDNTGTIIGTLEIASDGKFTFKPAPAYDGSVPVATYTISDGTDTATATLEFAPVPNTAPDAVDDGPITTVANTPATGSVIAGLAGVGTDTDAEQDKLTVTQFVIDADGNGTPTVITIPAGGKGSTPLKDNTGKDIGTLEIASDGAFTFTPAPGYDGPVPVATYTISDGTATDTATLTFADLPNTPPIAVNDGPIVTAPNTNAVGNVIDGLAGVGKDSDADGDTLTVTQFQIDADGDGTLDDPIIIAAGSTATATLKDADGNSIGTLEIGSDGGYTFTPTNTYDGPVPKAVYTITDGTDTDTAELSFLDVPNTPPDAVNDVPPVAMQPNTPVNGNLLLNDSDVDGDQILVTQFSIDTNGDGTPETIPVLAGTPGTATLKDATGKDIGTLEISSNGVYTFTPANTYDGPVPVATYTITDGTDTATATLTIPNVPNTPPVAVDDKPIPTIANTPATGNVIQGADDGTGKDSDPDGDTLTVTQFAVDSNGDGTPEIFTVPVGGKFAAALADAAGKPIGTLEIGSDGTFTFTPAPAYDGPVPSTTYTISDGTDTATAKLEFAPVPNTVPVAVNDGPITTAPNTAAIGNVIDGAGGVGKDSDPDGDTLTVTQFSVDTNGDGTAETFTVPANGAGTATLKDVNGKDIGTLSISDKGVYTFTPAAAYDGPVPVATYTISDGTDTATATLEFAPVPNTLPVAVNDGPITTTPDTPATGNVIDGLAGAGKDTDADGDTLTVTQFSVNTNGDGTPDTITVPANGTGTTPLKDATGKDIGTLAIGSDGAYTFTPAPGYKGPVPPVTYTISDGTDTATANLTFADVPNSAPEATDDIANVSADTFTASGNVIAGIAGAGQDTDANGDTLKLTQFTVDSNGDGIPDAPISVPDGGSSPVTLNDIGGTLIGTLTVSSDGSFNFVANPDFTGEIPAINYTISDGVDTASAALKIENLTPAPPANLPPVATDDGPIATKPNAPATGSVLGNDSDPEGSPLQVTKFSIAGIPGEFAAGTTATIPGVGTVVINLDGSFNFTPNQGYAGPVPPVTYTLSDGQDTDTAVLKFADVPIVADDDSTVTQNPDGSFTGNVLDNDGSSGNGPLHVTQFTIPGLGSFTAGTTANIPGVGAMIINADGSFNFTPAPGYSGSVPTASYTVTDGKNTDTALLTLPDVQGGTNIGALIMLSNPTQTYTVPDSSSYTLPQFRQIDPFPLPSNEIPPSRMSLYGNLMDYYLYMKGSLRNQVVIEQKEYDFFVSRAAFEHSNANEELTFEASQADGSPLPPWLKFNAKELKFTGRPPKGAQNVEVIVTASDRYGHKASGTFKVQVNRERTYTGHSPKAKLHVGLTQPDHQMIRIGQDNAKPAIAAKLALNDQLNNSGRFSRLMESRALLDSLSQL